MPRDPQGAGTRTETRVVWRPVCRRSLKNGSGVYEWNPCEETTEQDARAVAQEVRDAFGWDAFAVEEVTTVTTITRHPIPPHAGEETKG